MKCPICGKEMEPGMMRTDSFLGGAKWLGQPYNRSNKHTLASPDWLGYIKMYGFRCADCRQLVLNY
ncbi:MAG TPA: PF20097 family protein [Methanomassiliicoccales archaeon]